MGKYRTSRPAKETKRGPRMNQKQPPKAVREWISDGEHTEAEAKHYIRTNVEFFETSIADKAGQGANNWIALKLDMHASTSRAGYRMGKERGPRMMQLPEMLMRLGRWSGILGLICAVIGIVIGVDLLLEENPLLAAGISLSVIGLIIAMLNLVAKKGGSR